MSKPVSFPPLPSKPTQLANKLAAWQQSVEGGLVLEIEHRRVNEQLARATVLMRSDVIFQLRPWFEQNRLVAANVQRLSTAESLQSGQWPLPEEPVDLLLLPHEFELCDQPAELLSWASKVLDDKGWLIVTGFKPPGFLAQLIGGRIGKPWVRQRVSSSMVRLWLQEAGYKVLERESWSYQESAGLRGGWVSRLLPARFRPKHYGYLVAARKTDMPGTPLRGSWKPLANTLSVQGSPAASRLGKPLSYQVEAKR